METKEVFSRGEEVFEEWRKKIGLLLGPILFIVIYLVPIPSLSPPAHTLFAVFVLVLVYWFTEAIPIPVTALLGAVLNVFLGVGSPAEVFSPFSHQIVFLFIGSFMLAEAITLHGLDRRFSLAILSIRFLEKNPLRILFALGLVTAVISMWISNSAATAMMMPIALGVLKSMQSRHQSLGIGSKEKHGWRDYSSMAMLMLAYGASVGGISTPIGTPPNLIGIGMLESLAGVKINFFEWMGFALPITIVMFAFLFIILGGFNRSLHIRILGIREYAKGERKNLGAWKQGEINTLACFLLAVFLWLFPSFMELILGRDKPVTEFLSSALDEGVVAILAAVLLFIIPISFKEKTFTMTWDKAVRIDWGTIILFGGGLSLGKLMFSTGLSEAFGKAVVAFTGAETLWGITAISTLIAIILSETTSNTATASMVIPVVIAIAQSAGVSPVAPALGACLGASFGFMLPVSTPPNAIVYGSGKVPLLTMLKKGILFDIAGLIIIVTGLMILCPMFGWV